MTALIQPERIAIRESLDIIAARKRGRELALKIGFSSTEATLVATAISELCRNMVLYAKGGDLMLAEVRNAKQRGITVVAEDTGPGIKDLRRALAGGFSTSGGLGLGLSGVRRLMSATDVLSEPGQGTKVTTTMWLP